MTKNKIILEDLDVIYTSAVNWDRFAGKSILITGANGFLPAYLVQALLYANSKNSRLNLKVFALVRDFEKAKSRFIDYMDNPALTFVTQDVCDTIKLSEKVHFIIHAASQASPKFYGTDPVGTLSANVIGTKNLLDFAKIQLVESFLYFSSGEVYGQVENEHNPVQEDHYGYLNPMMVRACYGESKRMGENMCVSYHHQFGMDVKVVRPFHTYGPGMDLNDGRVYADFVSNIVAGKDIEMKSDGKARRAFCYLTDATIGFLTVLLNGEAGQAYNVGNPKEEYSIIELAEIIITLGPKKSGIKLLAENHTNSYFKSPIARNTPSVNKIAKLGWIPSTTVLEGFKRTIDSFF